MIDNPKTYDQYTTKYPNCNRNCTKCDKAVYIQGLGMDIYQMCRYALKTIRNNINDCLKQIYEQKDKKDH